MLEWAADLKIAGIDLYLDSRSPRSDCFISHAHTICTPATSAFAEHRVGPLATVVRLDYGTPYRFADAIELSLVPAGHVVGSAMLHVIRPEGSLLYTGDFKLRESLTVETAAPRGADVLVMEST